MEDKRLSIAPPPQSHPELVEVAESLFRNLDIIEEAREGELTIVVRPGDSLYGIAERYAISVEDLLTRNGFYPDFETPIREGTGEDEDIEEVSAGRAGAILNPGEKLILPEWAKETDVIIDRDDHSQLYEKIDSIELTPEGYQNFVENIDETWFERIKSADPDEYPNFRTGNSKIEMPEQLRTEYFIWHYTAGRYRNGAEDFIAILCDSESPVGAQYFIDQEGKAYHLTDEKVCHVRSQLNSISEGVELEAWDESDVLPQQLEAAMYLAVHRVNELGLLRGGEAFRDRVFGHGELRNKFGVMTDHADFTAGPAEAMTEKCEGLMAQLDVYGDDIVA